MPESDQMFLCVLPGFTFVHLSLSLFFQIFLNYTVAGSSFVFGDTLVKDVFAFQVIICFVGRDESLCGEKCKGEDKNVCPRDQPVYIPI